MTKAKKILGLIGRGVDYSYSPLIHNTAFEALGLPCYYTVFNIADPALIGNALEGARALGIAGFNVTIPYKKTVVPFLDELSPEAAAITAVNTIVNTDGRLSGHNTDIAGFASPLLRFRNEISGKRVCIFGSGGAALAAIEAFRIYFSAREILLFVRERSRAQSMLRDYTGAGMVMPHLLGDLYAGSSDCIEKIRNSAVLVNATPIGTKGSADETGSIIPTEAGIIHNGQIVYDMVYNPYETPLLAAARKAGAETVPGIEMLVGQAARSFELWTGMTMPLEVVKPKVLEELRGRT